MKKAVNFLNKLEIWFFYGFLVTFTLSIRKVLFFYPIQGQFNEYTGIYLYLSDIFVFLAVVSWALSILYNKIVLKSMYRISIIPFLRQKVILLPLLLVILSFTSVNWSDNWQIATFRSVKLLEFYLLYLWVIFRMFHPSTNVPRGTFYGTGVEHSTGQAWNIFKNSILIIITTGFVQSIIGIWQFIAQKSLGLIWLKESIISPDISGVAKIVLNGEKYIRAYGLFPHPNILGGFLVLSVILIFAYFKPFNFLLNSKEVQKKTDGDKMFHVEHFTQKKWSKLLFYLILVVQLFALILTFSKSAWMGLMIALIFLWLKIVPRGTIYDANMNDIKEQVRNISWNKYETARGAIKRYFKHFALIAGILLLLVVIVKPNWYSLFGKSIEDRIFYLNVSPARFVMQSIAGGRGAGVLDLLLGTGVGQSILYLEKLPNIENWQFQPVHNVFLLILNELGIIGLILFIWFILEVIKIKNVPRGTFCNNSNCLACKAVFWGFLFIMLFDHYFWDIQQGQIMFWLILGLIIGSKMWITREKGVCPQVKNNKY